jgi:hypothetical protein
MVTEGRRYVMEGLFDKLCLPEQWRGREGPAQAASRGWKSKSGAAEGGQTHQNGGRAMRSLKRRRFLPVRQRILFRATRTKMLGKHCSWFADSRASDAPGTARSGRDLPPKPSPEGLRHPGHAVVAQFYGLLDISRFMFKLASLRPVIS